MSADIEDMIAKAIKKADKSYFFENYSKQASAVLSVLDKEGFKVVPKRASERQIEAGTSTIGLGRVRPQDFVHTLYAVMVAASDK